MIVNNNSSYEWIVAMLKYCFVCLGIIVIHYKIVAENFYEAHEIIIAF